jgi:hypothetical protein
MYTICSHIGYAASALVRPGNESISVLGAVAGQALCTRAEAVLPHMRVPGSDALIEAVKTGNRRFF